MSQGLTEKVKNYANEMGADLIGIADLARWKSAPFNRTPQALMPDCTCAIVMGFHYLDACVELGGQPDIRIPGPSASNHIASEHGNYTAFKLCKFIEKAGYDALMVPATAWWNYRANEASPRGFSADITHYYAACAAGLGEIAWNNLCLTPEFGPRQRWVTVVTNAPLRIDPMYGGEPLCDHCKLCEKHCPGQVFDKESEGTITVDFGEKSYTFKHKNLWRCALGENFQLDSYMERPEVTNEAVIERLCEDWAAGSPDNRFSWKMGQCLKWCMPRKRRYFDRAFTASPRRRRDVEADYSEYGVQKAKDLLIKIGKEIGISRIAVWDSEKLLEYGIDIKQHMPTARSAIAVMQHYPEHCEGDTARQCLRNALWLAKKLQELGGYDGMVESGISRRQVFDMIPEEMAPGNYQVHTILTGIPFECFTLEMEEESDLGTAADGAGLSEYLKQIALENGAELFGISNVERLDQAADQLEVLCKDEDYFISVEQGFGEKANRMIDMKGKPKNPKTVDVRLHAKRPSDYLENAGSVIVVGLAMLRGSVKNVMKPPAYKAAHYGATVHKEMFYQNHEIALKLCKVLEAKGYQAYMTDDLIGLSSTSYSFMLPDIRANHIPAVCAGLGALGKNGLAINERYGSAVRYVAIVTDAPLHVDKLADMPGLLCKNCEKCIAACPAAALDPDETVMLEIEGKRMELAGLKRLRCDWAMRYGLMKEAGPKCLGSTNDYPVPEVITREKLVETIKDSDRLQISNFAPIVEKCMIDCPYHIPV